MRIIMPTLEPLEWMPPTINLIKKLSFLGYDVVCITLFPSEYLQNLNIPRVTNIWLSDKNCTLQNKIPYIKGVSGILYRLDKVIKKLVAKKLKKIVDQELKKGGFLWVVNEMTVVLAGVRFLKKKNYAFTVYELHERKWYARNIEKAAKMARIVIVPEYNRAHIMAWRYRLKNVPYVMPNKSDILLDDLKLSEDAVAAIKLLTDKKNSGKKVILYMGGINKERPLEGFLNSISKNDKYVLAIIGRQTTYLDILIRKYRERIIYLGAYNPPVHLAVAEHADIGLLNYVGISNVQGLNALYCAPNKIFEYTGLGLPVIGNDIPGLRNDILYSHAGEVVDFDNSEEVLMALEKIFNSYNEYSKNALSFYDGVDIDKTLIEILSNFN